MDQRKEVLTETRIVRGLKKDEKRLADAVDVMLEVVMNETAGFAPEDACTVLTQLERMLTSLERMYRSADHLVDADDIVEIRETIQDCRSDLEMGL